MADDRLQEELDALAVALGRSLTVDSPAGELVAYSAQSEDADRARVSSILLRRVAPEVRDWERRHTGDDPRVPVRIPENPGLGMSARLCVPLLHRERPVGLLWMLAPDGIGTGADPGFDAVLRRGTAALARLLAGPTRGAGDAEAPGREVDRLVGRLFEDGQSAAYGRLAVARPGVVDGTVRVLALVPAAGGAPRPLRGAEFEALSGSLTPRLRVLPGWVGAHVTTAYVLAALHDPAAPGAPVPPAPDPVVDAVVDAVVRAVRRLLDGDGDGALGVGVSDPAPLGLRSARESRTQAVTAAELSVLDPALGGRVAYGALGAYRSLLRAPAGGQRVLAPLDDAGSSAPMLLETLEVFLDLAGDIRSVSSRLRLHRSSLYYRLDRISRLLGADLSDGLVRLELHTALKVRRAARRTLR